MESLSYFCFSLPYVFLIVFAFLTFSYFLYMLRMKLFKPEDFSRLPKARREISVVISIFLCMIILTFGISEYFKIRENLYWANQPHICYEASLRQDYYLRISNSRENYLGMLFERGESEVKVFGISEFAIVNDYLVGEEGISSQIFFIFDLETGDIHYGLSKNEIIAELNSNGISIHFPLTPIIGYCETADCSPCGG